MVTTIKNNSHPHTATGGDTTFQDKKTKKNSAFLPRMELWIVLLTMVSGMVAVSDAMRTFCKKSDSKCDSTWVPLDNLGASLVGYDLPTGDPFASNFIEDPGLKKQIFNATKAEGDFYQLESGISVREYKMCDERFNNRVATALIGYKQVREME